MHMIETSVSTAALFGIFVTLHAGNRKSEVAMMQAVLYISLPLGAACLPQSLNQDSVRKGFMARPLRWCPV